MQKKFCSNLLDFLQDSPCSFLAVEKSVEKLDNAGFICLNNVENWKLIENGKYYITRNDSSLIAFIIGENTSENGFRLIGSHTDSPALSVKPNAEINEAKNYLKINTEPYGGMILSTWFDRPLSLAGRVVLKGEDIFTPKTTTVNIKKPIAIIPNLAIHMNREINNGHKYSKQKEMLPILSLTGEDFNEKGYVKNLVAKQLKIDRDDILDYELFFYEAEKGCFVGTNEDFVSASRLDDLMMVYTSLEAFIKYSEETLSSIKVLYLADNEEVGSHTGQGADSSMLRDTLKRICISLFGNEESFYSMCEKSVFMSADLAHALHPNYSEKHDITNKPLMGKGVCLKYASSQKYSTSSIAGAIFTELCKEADIPFQKFVNNSDALGGGTIGSMIASQFNIPVIDFGVPVLGMHSIRELGASSDIYDCYKLFYTFYKQ